jgi:hypothetical protein
MSAQGLGGKLQEIVGSLNDARRNPYDDKVKRWKPVTLSGYLSQKKTTKQHLYAELGIDAHRTRISDLFDNVRDGGYLFNEIIQDAMLGAQGYGNYFEARLAPTPSYNDFTNPVHRTITPEKIAPFMQKFSIEQAFYQAMTAGQVANPESDYIAAPYLDFSGVAGRDTAEGATVEIGQFKIERKNVQATKITTGFEVTYENIQSSTIAQTATFFEAFGRMHAAKKNGRLMSVIVNGNTGFGDSAPVIGVTTANSLVNRDVYRVRQRMVGCGYTPSIVCATEETGLDYLDLPAVQGKQQPAPSILPVNLPQGVWGATDYFPSYDLSANSILHHDPRSAVMEYVYMGFMIETEKIIRKQLSLAVASESQVFVKQMRQASVIMRRDLAFSGNGWPTYMQPLRSL